MFTIQFVVLLLGQVGAFATGSKSGYHVDQLDPAADVSSLQKRHIVRTRDQLNVKQQLPSRDERENAFRISGIAEEVQKMDELDRDVLYLAVKTKPLKAVWQKYPKLSRNSLAKLSELVRSNAEVSK